MATAWVRLRVVARVAAATVGAYVVTAGVTALLAVVLIAAAAMSKSDAIIVGSLVAYVLFAVLMLWSFAEKRLARVWLRLAGAGVFSHGLAILITAGLGGLATTP